MASQQELSFLNRFKIFQINREIIMDGAKYLLIPGLVSAKIIMAWPEDVRSKSFEILVFVMSFIQCVTIITSIVLNIVDVNTTIMMISAFEAVLQVVGKFSALIIKSKDLDKLIKTVRYEFWPSDITNKDTAEKIRKDSRILFKIMMIESSICIMVVLTIAFGPLLKTGRVLPYPTWYPFDTSASPVYEIVYILQSYFGLHLSVPPIIAYDMLYYSLCANCTAQFRLLCDALRCIGNGTEDEMITKLVEFDESQKELRGTSEQKLLILCIKHHQRLINTANEISQAFGNGHLVQLMGSASGICTACYILTSNPDLSSVANALVQYIAHVGQIFIYCAVSNELSYWSTLVPTAAYESLWYKKKYPNIRQCLAILITRSQIAISMQAFGLFELNYTSFLSIMRFTFSLYTFLSSFA
uniref:Odorant receptor n=1 Tax=Anomala corpulenta TaxID=931571 RepID=A0A0E3U373_9SCAR|nr:odorant receptor 26 [Anomala corpulenta]